MTSGFVEFSQLCRDKAPAALNRVAKLAQHKDPAIRLQANRLLIGRAWGQARDAANRRLPARRRQLRDSLACPQTRSARKAHQRAPLRALRAF